VWVFVLGRQLDDDLSVEENPSFSTVSRSSGLLVARTKAVLAIFQRQDAVFARHRLGYKLNDARGDVGLSSLTRSMR
jgi:hypothetical protein